jgi:DNA-binding NarL/FixJ family response regulator
VREKITIGVVDDHPMFLQGLKRALRSAAHLEFVAEGASAEDACRIASKIKPDILLVDIGIPGNGIKAAETIGATAPSVKVIMVTGSDEDDHVERALAAGAKGYLLKGAGAEEVISAINTVHEGKPFITPLLASRLLVERFNSCSTPRAAPQVRLNRREQEILDCAAQGMTNKEIAEKLGLQLRSVKNYMSRVLLKLGVRNRMEAIIHFART